MPFINVIHDLENSGREQLRLYNQHCAQYAHGLAACLDDVELLLCRGQYAGPVVENFQHFHDESDAHHRSGEDIRVSRVCWFLIKVCIQCNRHRTSMAADSVQIPGNCPKVLRIHAFQLNLLEIKMLELAFTFDEQKSV